MGLVIAALLLAHSVSEAQAPGGGGRGGRGGGPGGGFGGGFGGGLISLATRPGVQAELNLTDKQKTEVQALSDKVNARRKDQMEKMREMFKGGRGPRAKGQDPAATTETETAKAGTGSTKGKAADAKGKLADSKGKTADAKGKTGKASAKGKAAAGNAGGNGGPGADFRAAMDKQRAEDEAALAKILNPTQRTRLAQIDLQQQGPYAFATPDLQKKLRMTPSQVADVDAIMEESRNAQRDAQRAMGGGRGNRGNGGNGGNGNGGGNGGQANGGGGGPGNNQGQGGQANGGGGGRGQGGRGNRGQGGQPFNKEDFQKKMEDPQFKAEMEQRRAEFQAAADEVRNQTMKMIADVLSKNQKVAYNKMRGDDFDRAKLDPNYVPTKEAAPKASNSKKKTTKSKSKKSA